MKRIILLCMAAVFLAGTPVFSQVPGAPQLTELKGAMDEFTANLAKSLPFNSSMGLNWSDAYIKNFPHFGAGVSAGYTTMKADGFIDVLNKFDMSLPSALNSLGGFPVPGYALEARLGGFFLPFDMGFKFGIMPLKPANLEQFDYFLIGGDIRYALVKEKLLLPNISIGIGFNHISGALGMSVGEQRIFNYTDASNDPQTLTLQKPTVTLDWATSSLDFKAQISKSFVIVTPYLGIGASKGWSRAGYDVKTDVDDSGHNVETASQYFHQFGIDEIDLKGFSSVSKFPGWSFRAFGGLSFNAAILRIDLTGLYNFVDTNYGLSLGIRIQV